MPWPKLTRVLALGGLLLSSVARAEPPSAPRGADADTRAWWALTAALSGDDMEGRDTGSSGHARAARYLARRFAGAGLRPMGDAGTWFQTVPLTETRVESSGTRFEIVAREGRVTPLTFLHQISVRPTDVLPSRIDAPLSFRGYCSTAEMSSDLTGRVAVCFGGRRRGVADATERLKAASAAGAVGLIAVDDPGFTLEPARWPEAYARSVSLAGDPPPFAAKLVVMRLDAQSLAAVIEGSGQNASGILAAGAASRPLPSFDIPARLRAKIDLSHRSFTSQNVLGLLPGSDAVVGSQVVVVSAHLDGYGRGEPVAGDSIYNGAFDDAAYVATLTRLAEQRQGRGFRRGVLFAAFTGEEKGLLGATWFTRHSTVPVADLAADINLDQLRPLFPLRILTMHALDDTTLGETAREVGRSMDIEIRPDLEPDRHLVQRADHWPFLKIGVPATGFVFGYDPGSEAERRYRLWYQVRYHRPQDDMGQPIDFQAAAAFNRFFYRLTAAVADGERRPAMRPGSPFSRP